MKINHELCYNSFLGLLIICSIVLIGLSLSEIIANPDSPNYISEDKILEYMLEFEQNRAEEKISRKVFEDLEQENANLKMTVSTFEAVISTLDANNQKLDRKLTFLEADNEKLSEIIHEHNSRVSGWELFWLLLLTSGLGGGSIILIQQLTKTY